MKKLFLLFMSLLFVIGVQSIEASNFIDFDEGIVITQDVTSIDIDVINMDLTLSQTENYVKSYSYEEDVITDNLKYPVFKLDAMISNEYNLAVYTITISQYINKENRWTSLTTDDYFETLNIGKYKAQCRA